MATPGQDLHEGARAYLGRAETRISTLHRIAGLFVSGAGLLVLFPAFLSNALSVIVATGLDPRYRGQMAPCTLGVLISALLPLYALYLLLKDLVHFYFTPEYPGVDETWFYPRFVLSGIAYSLDETPEIKQRIYELQKEKSYRYFLLRRKGERNDQFDSLLNESEGKVIPDTRKPPEGTPEDERNNLRRFAAAFGMTGTLDRSIEEEVAKTEVSLVRHTLLLRRLVLRYFKALLMFIWTVIVTFAATSVLHVEANQQLSRARIVVATALYGLWAITTPFVVKKPINWIHSLGDPDKTLKNRKINRDPDLQHFENSVMWSCYFSFVAGVSYLAVAHYVLSWF